MAIINQNLLFDAISGKEHLKLCQQFIKNLKKGNTNVIKRTALNRNSICPPKYAFKT